MMLILTALICYAESYTVKVHISPYNPCLLLIVDREGNLVLFYKPPDEAFSVKLSSGEYYVYVEEEKKGTVYVGYSKITVPRDAIVNITLKPIEKIQREKVKIELGEEVKEFKVTTLSGFTIFETSGYTSQIIQIPRITLLVEFSEKNGSRLFFYDPEYNFGELLNLITGGYASLGEKGPVSESLITTPRKQRMEIEQVVLRIAPLDNKGMAFWTAIILLTASAIFILSRKRIRIE